MREALPFAFPKLIVSTVASGDTSHIVGESDIAGSDSIPNDVLDNAAGAIVGMARAYQVRLQHEYKEEQGTPEGTQKAAPRKEEDRYHHVRGYDALCGRYATSSDHCIRSRSLRLPCHRPCRAGHGTTHLFQRNRCDH